MNLVIRTIQSEDVDALSGAFESWPKPRQLFVDCAKRAADGSLDLVIAELAGRVAGFIIIVWESTYPPFEAAGIPEIADFNVLPGGKASETR